MLNIYKVCIYAYISPILVIRSAMNSRMVCVCVCVYNFEGINKYTDSGQNHIRH